MYSIWNAPSDRDYYEQSNPYPEEEEAEGEQEDSTVMVMPERHANPDRVLHLVPSPENLDVVARGVLQADDFEINQTDQAGSRQFAHRAESIVSDPPQSGNNPQQLSGNADVVSVFENEE